jgi:hypothetical protein
MVISYYKITKRKTRTMNNNAIDTLILKINEDIQVSLRKIIQEHLTNHYKNEIAECESHLEILKKKMAHLQSEEHIYLNIEEKENVASLTKIIKIKEEPKSKPIPKSSYIIDDEVKYVGKEPCLSEAISEEESEEESEAVSEEESEEDISEAAEEESDVTYEEGDELEEVESEAEEDEPEFEEAISEAESETEDIIEAESCAESEVEEDISEAAEESEEEEEEEEVEAEEEDLSCAESEAAEEEVEEEDISEAISCAESEIEEVEEEVEEIEEVVEEESEDISEAISCAEVEEVEEAAEEVEDDEEVFEITIKNKKYYTNNATHGKIYDVDENDDPSDEIGYFKNGTPVFIVN